MNTAPIPNRLNEDWRFGRPHIYAQAMADMLAELDAPAANDATLQPLSAQDIELLASTANIGSQALQELFLQHFNGRGFSLPIEGKHSEPIEIARHWQGKGAEAQLITLAAGAEAHLILRNSSQADAQHMVLRRIHLAPGAKLKLEIHEQGGSHLLHINHIVAECASMRLLTTYADIAWAREETTAQITSSQQNASIELYSANKLSDQQVLDQHTKQLHACGQAYSNLLYKNVIDGHATATFAGNIYVAPGAHETDAYQANRNMMLSEHATVNSLPGLEILADKVRCSHGSASSPMNENELFYLQSRGIAQYEAQHLVAEGFLHDVIEQFNRDTEA